RVHLGPEPAARAPEGLVARFFWAPAALGWARTMVESSISHSTSGSWSASNRRFQTPARDHRSNRFQTVLGLPNRGGRSFQGMPVRATYRTASTNRRRSPSGPWRGSRPLIRSQSASEIACRGSIAHLPSGRLRYRHDTLTVHTP